VWFDVMVTSQHASAEPSKPSSWWMGTFKSSIARIGGLLLVVDAWDNPTALRRAWWAVFVSCGVVLQAAADDCLCCRCVLELHAIASKKEEGGGRFAVAMTAQENERFLRGIRKDYGEYYGMLGRVNAETSECSRASDRESIHEGIRRSVGFAKLSRMVFGVMEGWMEERLRGQAAASAAAGDESEAMDWKQVLAAMLLKQGRSGEAVELYENSLTHQRRVLPENHPHIGATWY
jgi:hypothetical protein